jgi:hypothetical protein
MAACFALLLVLASAGHIGDAVQVALLVVLLALVAALLAIVAVGLFRVIAGVLWRRDWCLHLAGSLSEPGSGGYRRVTIAGDTMRLTGATDGATHLSVPLGSILNVRRSQSVDESEWPDIELGEEFGRLRDFVARRSPSRWLWLVIQWRAESGIRNEGLLFADEAAAAEAYRLIQDAVDRARDTGAAASAPERSSPGGAA